MIAEISLAGVHWRKSSYSGMENAECVEVADGVPGQVPVRDSTDPHGPVLAFEPAAWTAFLTAIKNDNFHASDGI